MAITADGGVPVHPALREAIEAFERESAEVGRRKRRTFVSGTVEVVVDAELLAKVAPGAEWAFLGSPTRGGSE